MLSLANAFSEDELRAFNRRVSGSLERDDIAYVTELKIDGVAMALTYQNGRFVRGGQPGPDARVRPARLALVDAAQRLRRERLRSMGARARR